MAHIKFNNVTLQYPIYNSRSMSLRNELVKIGTGGRLARDSSDQVMITALKDVNFNIREGDSVGLIGHNGAGKTTLLRLMAGIYSPTSGSVDVSGAISTMIELGAGMDPELSGYENITRMGLMQGISRHKIEALIPQIEDFTGLGDFLAAPVRTYSAGMTTRLMFAVATSTKKDILLVDEMFATGDSDFSKKAHQRMLELIDHASIFVLASHSTELINQFCNRIFKIEHGALVEVQKFNE
jgi:ABC-type polysaccharide/polyol phosphate transport system ATPase subunit